MLSVSRICPILSAACLLNSKGLVLASVAQMVGHHPVNQKVMNLIPFQGICPGCGFGSLLGYV